MSHARPIIRSMTKPHNKMQRDRARANRRSMTLEETLVWQALRKSALGVRFNRQVPIGPYIVDFVARSLRLIVEIDGSHHRRSVDGIRDRWLEDRGYRIVRIWNDDVLEDFEYALWPLRVVVACELGEQPPERPPPILTQRW